MSGLRGRERAPKEMVLSGLSGTVPSTRRFDLMNEWLTRYRSGLRISSAVSEPLSQHDADVLQARTCGHQQER